MTLSRPAPDLLNPLKIWPSLAIAAWKANYGGAARVWFMARAVDVNGRGWVEQSDLQASCYQAGMKRRTLYRWLHEASSIGIIHKHGGRLFLAGLGRAAVLLNCEHIGRPVLISRAAFVRDGWRSHVWAGYLATVGERPISQRTKKRITGVTARTQRNYQHNVKSTPRPNYVSRGEGTQADADGYRDCLNLTVFCIRGRLTQRLPDIRTVPGEAAQACKPGRSKKAQRLINSSIMGRANETVVRLFHTSRDKARSSQRKQDHGDIPPWEMPEMFILKKAHAFSNTWAVA